MDTPPPDLLSWTFWFKDSASVRDLLVSLGAVIGLPLLIWREITGHRTVDIAAKRHEKQTEADRERRITDSFTKAVELLGKSEMEVRLGAIYALERIARESKNDHWPIIETLTAYVRTRSPAQNSTQSNHQSNQKPLIDEALSAYAVAILEGTAVSAQSKEKSLLPTPIKPDVDAVLIVLTRRNLKNEMTGQRINLFMTNMQSANMEGVELHQANLSMSNLENTIINNASLIGSHLRRANLNKAFLVKADLRDAEMQGAYLEGACLSRADLDGADLTGASLIEADLSGARLTCTLRRANLTKANLTKAILDGSSTKASLAGANLTGAILTGFDLDKVVLCNTTMPDGSINNRDCSIKLPSAIPSEEPLAPN